MSMYLMSGAAARPDQLTPIHFSQADATASQTDVALARGSANDAAITELVAPFAGSLVGISIAVEGARTAGTLTIEWTLDGVAQTATVVVDDTNTQYNQSTQAVGAETFTAGQRIGCQVTTDASWAAGTTPSISVDLFVSYGTGGRVLDAGNSVSMSYISAAAGTTITTQDTYYDLAGTYTEIDSTNFTVSGGVATYTGATAINVMLLAAVSGDSDTTDHYRFAWHKNDTVITNSIAQRNILNVLGSGSIIVLGHTTLANGDELDLKVTADTTDGSILTADYATLLIRQV